MTTLEDVYKKFGEVAEAAQILETELGNILLTVEGMEHRLFDYENKDLAKTILEKINRSTLGSLLKKIEKKVGGTEEAVSILQNALKDRNRLSHTFYREHNFRRNSSEGCDLMLQDLESMHENLIMALKVVFALSGVDLEAEDIDLTNTHVSI